MPIIRVFKPGVKPHEIGYADPNQKPWESKPYPGFVYLIKSSSGLFKIGVSVDPPRRLKSIRRQKQGEEIDLIHTIRADNQYDAESALHTRFHKKRKNYGTEWFSLSRADVEYICKIKSFEAGKFKM